MQFDFSSITGREDYDAVIKVQKSRWERIEEKYNHPGIYCIKLKNKIVYVGKSKEMLERVRAHMRHIKDDCERKYQILGEARLDGVDIQFDVLYYCPYSKGERQKADLTEKEAYYINYYLPPLNKVIPIHKDFEK